MNESMSRKLEISYRVHKSEDSGIRLFTEA